MKNEIKYVERKVDGLRGVGKVARVKSSKTGRTLYFEGKTLVPLSGFALKANYFDGSTFEEYWVSNPRQDGNDAFFPSEITIDEDVREVYWSEIRKAPEHMTLSKYKSKGKTKAERDRLEKGVRRHDMDRRFRAPRSSK